MKKYTEASLELVATLEQNMANGEDSGGKTFKTALPELRSLLEKDDLALSPEDKMRLLMIYMITQVRPEAQSRSPVPKPSPEAQSRSLPQP